MTWNKRLRVLEGKVTLETASPSDVHLHFTQSDDPDKALDPWTLTDVDTGKKPSEYYEKLERKLKEVFRESLLTK